MGVFNENGKLFLISKCSRQIFFEGREYYEFDFKGAFCGKWVKNILVESSEDLTISMSYILYLEFRKLDKEILWTKLEKNKALDDISWL